MDRQIMSALDQIPVADLSRADWLRVGMALREEGFPCSVWEDWSRNDTRYHPGECARLWRGFHGSSRPVTGGTIVRMARERGWVPPPGESGRRIQNSGMSGRAGRPVPPVPSGNAGEAGSAWNPGNAARAENACVPVPEDVPGRIPVLKSWSPAEDLITYLSVLFRPEERVSYVTGDVRQTGNGRWAPGRGTSRTAGELITTLKRYPDDLEAAIGAWRPEAGAWIRINPMDGAGIRDANVTAFRHCLVESDEMPLEAQREALTRLQLPIAALVHSGGRSLHAVVRVDARNADEYRTRVDFLYNFLDRNGFAVDRQDRNPSRLSRMPGVTRNGNRQYLVATDLGRRNWEDWMDWVNRTERADPADSAERTPDGLPDMIPLSAYVNCPPPLPEELIKGILRRGHKMLLSGSPKAAKSYLLMELCVAIAEGTPWLGFPCRKGRVLYVNLEIDSASAIHRLLRIYDALGLPPRHVEDIVLWNLRGHAVPLDQLVPCLIRRCRDQRFDAIVMDPIYKVLSGDENSASEMAAFCNQFDLLCAATGCSMIYCHHHSKGAQGGKRAMDRASGSGVFARDPDAQLDMIQLDLPEDLCPDSRGAGATAWRLETSLREFPNAKPVDFWFEYPIHRVDTEGVLADLPAQGGLPAGRERRKKPKARSREELAEEFQNVWQALSVDGSVRVQDMARVLNVVDKTVYTRIRQMAGAYVLKKGQIYLAGDPRAQD